MKMLDLAALLDVFHEANRIANNGFHYEVQVVSGSPSHTLMNHASLLVQSEAPWRHCLETPDTLLVIGGEETCAAASYDEHFLAWLRWQASRSRRIGSISSGTICLAEAGLLNGKRAAIHSPLHQIHGSRFPEVLFNSDVIYLSDSNLHTCAGAAASLDFALALVEEDLGSPVVSELAQFMLLYLRRPGRTPQVNAALRAQAVHPGPITELLTWLPGNLQQDLSVKNMARRSAMSPRNFARMFRRQVGVTPAKHIENLRFEAARFQLESSELTIDGVAFAAGFDNGETLRRLFVRRLGLTPGRYRTMKTGEPRSLDSTSSTGAPADQVSVCGHEQPASAPSITSELCFSI